MPRQATSQADNKTTESPKATEEKLYVEEKEATTELTSEKPSTIENVEKETVVHRDQTKPQGKYCIVMSSAVSQKNAERFTKHLKDAGYNAEIINNGKIRRVIISGFQTEESCREQIKEMHKNQEYKDCWFMKLD